MIPVVTAGYAAALGLLQLVLSMWVVLGRWSYKVSLGDGGHKEMNRRIRVHGNFTEYVPLALVLALLTELGGLDGRWPHAVGGLLVGGRVLHAAGLLRRGGPSPGRFVGMTLTYAALLVGSIGAGLVATRS